MKMQRMVRLTRPARGNSGTCVADGPAVRAYQVNMIGEAQQHESAPAYLRGDNVEVGSSLI